MVTEGVGENSGSTVWVYGGGGKRRAGGWLLHGPPMLADKTNFGLVLYNHANFYRFEELSGYWSVNKYQFFSAFHWSTSNTPPASQCTIQIQKVNHHE